MYIFVPKQISSNELASDGKIDESLEAIRRGDTIRAACIYKSIGVDISGWFVWGGPNVRYNIGPIMVHMHYLKLPENATPALVYAVEQFQKAIGKIDITEDYRTVTTPLPCLTNGIADSVSNIYRDERGNVAFYARYKFLGDYYDNKVFNDHDLARIQVYWSTVLIHKGLEETLRQGQAIRRLFEQAALSNTGT